MVDWHALRKQMDDIVDGVWSDPVTLRPWIVSELSEGVADQSRDAVSCPAFIRSTATSVQGAGAPDALRIESDVVISVQKEYAEQAEIQRDDRVTLPDGEYSVAYVDANAHERHEIHLVRLKQSP